MEFGGNIMLGVQSGVWRMDPVLFILNIPEFRTGKLNPVGDGDCLYAIIGDGDLFPTGERDFLFLMGDSDVLYAFV
jgi:hypothetical protein